MFWFAPGDDRNNPLGIFAVLAELLLAPIAAFLLQMALTRSREYEADRSGARLIGDGEPLARALAKIEASARQIPMPEVHREMAPLYIVSPLAGMNVSFKNLFS